MCTSNSIDIGLQADNHLCHEHVKNTFTLIKSFEIKLITL